MKSSGLGKTLLVNRTRSVRFGFWVVDHSIYLTVRRESVDINLVFEEPERSDEGREGPQVPSSYFPPCFPQRRQIGVEDLKQNFLIHHLDLTSGINVRPNRQRHKLNSYFLGSDFHGYSATRVQTIN